MDKVICVANIINNCKLVLNVGENDGVKIGDKFLIYTNSKDEILDPISKKSLGKLEIVKGKVTHVQAQMCTIESMNKREKTRTLIKDNKPSLGVSLLGYSFSTTSSQNTEEETIEVVIPFEEPEIGDLAKEI